MVQLHRQRHLLKITAHFIRRAASRAACAHNKQAEQNGMMEIVTSSSIRQTRNPILIFFHRETCFPQNHNE